jgi:hypothetical protein
MPTGAIADRWGVQVVILGQGVLLAITFVAVWLALPKVRKLD